MKREKLYPPYLWRYLVQQAFQKRHRKAPVMVANAVLSLNAWLKPTDRGLEWGSGRSTSWLAERVEHVVTVEHDATWHALVTKELARQGVADRVDYRLINAVGEQLDEPLNHPYAHIADELKDNSLDFVVVDGQMRLRCIQLGLSKVKPGGLLVLDGANRYLPNDFDGSHSTIMINRSEPLNEEWHAVAQGLSGWRAIHNSDGLWDTRFWVNIQN